MPSKEPPEKNIGQKKKKFGTFHKQNLIKANPYPYIKFLKMLRSFPFRAFFSTKKLYYVDDARKDFSKALTWFVNQLKLHFAPKFIFNFLQLFLINIFFFSKGRKVALENELGLPKITKDGVTVAQSIQFVPHFILNDNLHNLVLG